MTWTEAEAKFAANFDRYEPRLPQRELATHIEDALNAGAHLFAQAPCGVGKSYAGAVPAIDLSKKTGMPVALAPGTKALQDQYIRDMETLKSIYTDFEYVVAKGRSNYLCRAKMKDLDEALHGLRVDELTQAAEAEGINGDMDRLGFSFTPAQRRALTMTTEECPGKKQCPFGEVCYAERVKAKAKVANVVIVNHALLAIDAVLKAQGIEMLPLFGAIVLDEAQEFEGYATNALSSSVTEGSFTSLISEVANFLGDRSIVGSSNLAVSALFNRLREVMANRTDKRDNSVAITPAVLLACEDVLIGGYKMLEGLQAKLVVAPATHTEEDALRLRRLRKRTDNMIERMRSIIMSDFSDMVRWIEREVKENYRTRQVEEKIVLAQAPLDVAPFLNKALWPFQPVVFMSATLAIGDDFSYLPRKLGVDEYRTFDCESPFDFTTQAKTYVGKELPDPIKEPSAYRAAVNLNITELVRASDGRALLLFTSWDGLNTAYESVGPVIRGMGHRVFKQGEAPARDLAQAFKDDEHSVLFAVKSFFTGVDIQGDSLRLVVIDKFPFPVKDVLFSARCDALDAKVSPTDRFARGSFMQMWVPEMIITLLQGFGRGIRSRDDRALIAILDPRAYSKPVYGKKTLKALPPAPQVTRLQDALEYLHSLEVSG